MKQNVKLIGRLGVGLAVASLAIFAAGQTSYALWTASGPVGVGTLVGDASATFTLGSNTVTVVLTDLEENPTDAAQLVSGIQFNVSGATGSGSLGTTTGPLGYVTVPGGSYTANSSSSLTHWTASGSGGALSLGTTSGYDMVIGPDNAGSFAGTNHGGGKYSNADTSISNFDYSVLGSAQFVVNCPGVTSSCTISNVVFDFGTPDCKLSGKKSTSTTPEPVTFVIWSLLGALGLAYGYSRRRRN